MHDTVSKAPYVNMSKHVNDKIKNIGGSRDAVNESRAETYDNNDAVDVVGRFPLCTSCFLSALVRVGERADYENFVQNSSLKLTVAYSAWAERKQWLISTSTNDAPRTCVASVRLLRSGAHGGWVVLSV